MKTNHVREKAKAGKPTIGCFLGLGSPNVAGLMANAGLDWVVVELDVSTPSARVNKRQFQWAAFYAPFRRISSVPLP